MVNTFTKLAYDRMKTFTGIVNPSHAQIPVIKSAEVKTEVTPLLLFSDKPVSFAVSLNSSGETTLFDVPSGYRLILTHGSINATCNAGTYMELVFKEANSSFNSGTYIYYLKNATFSSLDVVREIKPTLPIIIDSGQSLRFSLTKIGAQPVEAWATGAGYLIPVDTTR